MKTSDKIDKIAPALVKAQTAIDAAKKGSINPHFKNRYADISAVIDAVKGPLNNNGICFMQLVQRNGDDVLETLFLHDSGQFIMMETKIYCNKPNDPQAFGSGITYAKRYALQAALGLPTEDDDGNAATQPAKKEEPPKKHNEKVFGAICDYIESKKKRGVDKTKLAKTITDKGNGWVVTEKTDAVKTAQKLIKTEWLDDCLFPAVEENPALQDEIPFK